MLSNADTIPIECNRKDISIVRTAPDIEIKTLAKQLKTMNAKLGRFLFLYFVPFHSCFSSSFPFLLLLSLLFRMFCTNNTLNMVPIQRVTCAEAKFLMQCVIFLPHTAQFWRFNEQISTTPAMINDSLVFVWPYTKFAHRILCAPCRNYSLERDSNVKINNDTCVIMIMIVRNQEHTHTLDSHFISISLSAETKYRFKLPTVCSATKFFVAYSKRMAFHWISCYEHGIRSSIVMKRSFQRWNDASAPTDALLQPNSIRTQDK